MAIKKEAPLSCDWKLKTTKRKKSLFTNKSKLYKYKGNFSWKGIKTERYKSAGKDWAAIAKQTFVGNHAESTKFHLRYFEVAPGGFSSFEKHRHEHVVIGIRGEGVCIVGKKRYHIGFLDTIYMKPNEPHQLRNPFKKPFGFFCIVNAKRDRPKAYYS
jgi:ribulose-bisphosphate carboxylase large chain